MPTSCLISTDLSTLRLLTPEGDEVWTAPAVENIDHPPPLREVAAAAAGWVAERLPGRTLDLLCVDVDESRCSWISTPTREPAVVAAAVRQRRAEWGDGDADAEMVQPLVGPAGSTSALAQLPLLRYMAPKPTEDTGDASAAVIETPDAAVKLWLDALDRNGVRVRDAASWWHVLARETEDIEGIAAAVVQDRPDRIVWCWAERGALIACGSCGVPGPPADGSEDSGDGASAAVGRLVLDWLTWASQLGISPARATVLAPKTGPIEDALTRAWPAMTCSGRDERDAAGVLLSADRAAPAEADALRSTPVLVQRPGRPHRRVYRLGAAAVALAALGVAGLAVKNQRAASRFSSGASALVRDGQQLVAGIAPGLETSADLYGALQSHFVQIRRDNPPLPDPPTPREIYAELDRLLRAVEPHEGVQVKRIDINDRTSSAQFGIGSYADGEALMESLRRQTDPLEWTERITGNPPNLTSRLTGVWK